MFFLRWPYEISCKTYPFFRKSIVNIDVSPPLSNEILSIDRQEPTYVKKLSRMFFFFHFIVLTTYLQIPHQPQKCFDNFWFHFFSFNVAKKQKNNCLDDVDCWCGGHAFHICRPGGLRPFLLLLSFAFLMDREDFSRKSEDSTAVGFKPILRFR